MTRAPRIVLTLLVAFTGLATFAQEQPDEILDRYVAATAALARSVTALPEDTVASLDELERAETALAPLARDTPSTALIDSLSNTFERARTAISNRSQADLAVQVAVIRGGYQRLVYEAALRQAQAGNLETARARINRVASDMGFSEAQQTQLQEAQQVRQFQLAFERGVAESAQARLTATREAQADPSSAYPQLAAAYGNFIAVQDSPRVPEATNASFVSAFQALVEGQGEVLEAQLDSLGNHMNALAQATEGTAAEAPTAPAPAPETAPETAEAAETPEPAPSPEAPAPPEVAEPTAPEDTAETDPPSEPEVAPAPPSPTNNNQVLAELEQEIASLGVPSAQRQTLASQLFEEGFESVEGAFERLYAHASRGLNALEAGDQEAARTHLRNFEQSYRSSLQPLVETRDSAFHEETVQLLESLLNTPALRLQDVVVLINRVDASEAVLAGESPSLTHQAVVTTSRYWSGLLRLIVMIVLAVLAFIPLRLLNLAFGGGNRNWQWVGASLFLLLLPVIYEGLSFLGALIADLSGIAEFNLLSTFSIFQNTLAQVVWALLTALAILFASIGLWGICVQFGLVGRRAASEVDTAETQIGNDIPADTVVEWDEDF